MSKQQKEDAHEIETKKSKKIVNAITLTSKNARASVKTFRKSNEPQRALRWECEKKTFYIKLEKIYRNCEKIVHLNKN